MTLTHVALAAALASTLFTQAAHADADPPSELTGKGLVTTGEVFLTLNYLVSFGPVIGTTTCDSGWIFPECHSYSGWLLLPVIGPTIAIFDNLGKPTMSGEMAFYGVSTAINVAGLALTIGGAIHQANARKARLAMSVQPTFAASTRGASFGIGRFDAHSGSSCRRQEGEHAPCMAPHRRAVIDERSTANPSTLSRSAP